MKHGIQWDTFLRLINEYGTEAERCLECGLYLAGFACVRAALETALASRYLSELWGWRKDDLAKYRIKVNEGTGYLHGVDLPPLKELIDQAGRDGLLGKKATSAAHRIREYGNRIHPAKLAEGLKLPQMGKRNLRARLGDLELVFDELFRSL